MPTTTTEIPLDAIDELASELPEPGAVNATIEIMSDEFGDQVEARNLPWHRLIYDEPNRILEVSLQGRSAEVPVSLRHEIHEPTRIWVEKTDDTVRTISIETVSGSRTLIRFTTLPSLPGS